MQFVFLQLRIVNIFIGELVMEQITFRPIDALEAKRRTDDKNGVIENKDELDELNNIYGQIHDAINHGRYMIRIYVHHLAVIEQLETNGYNLKFINKHEEMNLEYPNRCRTVVIFDISWGEDS